jgi:hypothetical protein
MTYGSSEGEVKDRKYQVVARIVKVIDESPIDRETVFGPCPDEGAAMLVLAALAGREDVFAARIEPARRDGL